MSGGPASSSARVAVGLSGFDLIVDLLVGIVIFVIVIAVAAVLMALLQAVLPGGSGEETPPQVVDGGGDAKASHPGVTAEVGQHPVDEEVRRRDTTGSSG